MYFIVTCLTKWPLALNSITYCSGYEINYYKVPIQITKYLTTLLNSRFILCHFIIKYSWNYAVLFLRCPHNFLFRYFMLMWYQDSYSYSWRVDDKLLPKRDDTPLEMASTYTKTYISSTRTRQKKLTSDLPLSD